MWLWSKKTLENASRKMATRLSEAVAPFVKACNDVADFFLRLQASYGPLNILFSVHFGRTCPVFCELRRRPTKAKCLSQPKIFIRERVGVVHQCRPFMRETPNVSLGILFRGSTWSNEGRDDASKGLCEGLGHSGITVRASERSPTNHHIIANVT